MSQEVNTTSTHRDDRLRSLSWAMILIWTGLVFLADNIGLLRQISTPGSWPGAMFFNDVVWTAIFLGAGVIVLIEVGIRLAVPSFSSESISGRLVFAMILFGIGLSGIFGWNMIWPLVLIAVGVSVLLGAISRQRN